MGALLTLLSRRRFVLVAALAFILFLLLQIVATKQMTLADSTSSSPLVTILPHWRELLFRQRSPFVFEAIAAVTVDRVRLFVSPINLLIATLLAVLVALNVTLSYAHFQRLGLRGGQGFMNLLSALPALVSGTACCVPTLILVLGLQFTGILSLSWPLLLPLSVLLLLTSLWWSLRRSPWLCRKG